MDISREHSRNGNGSESSLLARNVATVAQLEATERARLTGSQRVSNAVARMAGTAWFAGLHVVWFAGWVAWNTGLVPRWRPIDPFPFSFLTLVVSLEAIFLSIFVLISQNALTRQSERRAHLDLQINLLAEQESTRTVALLERIAEHFGVPIPADVTELELAAPTDIRDVISTLDQVLPADSCESGRGEEGSRDGDPGHDGLHLERSRPA
jgi:uncharacterized membrane protein